MLYFSGAVTAMTTMGRAYSDDLRVRILEADERGEGSCRVLAKRFGVSWEYVRKLRRQQAATGQKARVAQSRYGILSKVTEPVKALYLPPYSLDLNPIEKAGSKFKQLLRSAKARTEQALHQAITQAIHQRSAENAQACFRLTLNSVQP